MIAAAKVVEGDTELKDALIELPHVACLRAPQQLQCLVLLEVLAAIELRNRAWFDERTRGRTLEFLRNNELSYVCVDSPPGFESSVPAVGEVTSRALSVVRFHGRNTDNWEAKVTRASQRFRYLYDERELLGWLPMIRAISEQAEEVHLVFNNCYGNYATTNALEMTALLLRERVASPT